jgi:hypothetical protein
MVTDRTEPSAAWMRLKLAPMPMGSWRLIRRGQRFCYALRRVRLLKVDEYDAWFGERCERIEILAPPDLVAIWKAPAPGEWTLVRVAAGYLLGMAEDAIERLDHEHIPF